MINIIFKFKKNMIYQFEVKGHANMSTFGTDIVCSAISSTTLMTINGLLEVLNLNFEYDVKEGYTLCNLGDNLTKESQILLNSYFVFIKELAIKYPKNLKLKIMEVWKCY